LYIPAETLDDLLRKVFTKILKSNNHVCSTRGNSTELLGGVLLKLSNPKARLSRTEVKGTLFSCLGELIWYLAKSNSLKFIRYYIPPYANESDDGKTIYGGYGPRIFKMRNKYNQFEAVIKLLKEKPTSRRAVIQLFDASDLSREHKDIPCTCTLQFMIRKNQLHMFTNMRSNDAFLGLPHDIFAFTMLQEIMSKTLSVGLGSYSHAVGSLHLYEKDREKAEQYLAEGWQPTKLAMPAMPNGNPSLSIGSLLDAELKIRNGTIIELSNYDLPCYWADLVRLLQIFKLSNISNNKKSISKIEREMSTDIYLPYIQKRKDRNLKNKTHEQFKLIEE